MIIERFILTPFQQNTRVVVCERSGEAICIDPGGPSSELQRFISNNRYELRAITLTHGHLDHIGGTASLHAAFPDAAIILHRDDEPLYYGLPEQGQMLGLEPAQLEALGFDSRIPPTLTRNWEDGEIFEVGELRFSVRHCPGHTPGHVVLAEEKEKAVFVGDCLFHGSIGRTDLPGGSYEQLLSSIRRNILDLEDDFTVCSGHGPDTTVGHERRTNPFLSGLYKTGGRYI